MKKIIFSNIFFSMVIILLGLIGSVLISRSLGPVQRGEIAAIILWPTLLTYLGSVGTYQAVIFHFSKKNRDIQNFWGACIWITILNATVSIILGSVFIYLSLKFLSVDLKWYSFYLLIFLPINIITQFISCLMQAKSLFREYNLTRLFIPLFYLAGIVILFELQLLTVKNIVMLQLTLTVMQFFVFIILFNRRIGTVIRFRFHKKTIKILYDYGYRVWLGDLSQGLNVKMDQILISGMLSSKDLGIYVAATSIANFTSIVPNAFRIVLMPLVSSVKKMREKLQVSQKYLRGFLLMNFGLTAFCVLLNPIAIPILYGEEFNDSILISNILVLGFFFLNLKSLLGSIMQGFGKPMFVSYSEITGLVSLLILVYPFTIKFGIIGASLAISIGYLVQFITLYFYFIKVKRSSEN